MRSKVLQRILADTSECIEHKVDSYSKLILCDISSLFPLCKHEFEVRDQYWSSCKHCGIIITNNNDH